jgi:hypothetical protein
MAHHLRNAGDKMRNGDFLNVMLKYPSDGEGEDYSLKRNRSNEFSNHHGNNSEIRIVTIHQDHHRILTKMMLVYPCYKERAL